MLCREPYSDRLTSVWRVLIKVSVDIKAIAPAVTSSWTVSAGLAANRRSYITLDLGRNECRLNEGSQSKEPEGHFAKRSHSKSKAMNDRIGTRLKTDKD